jgi:hypothetical protein
VNDPEIKTGDKCYWVDGGKEYEVYPAKGEKQRAHFRCMPGVVIDANRAFHKDCQYYLQETKCFEYKRIKIQASKVLLEHEAKNRIKQEILNYSMIPDCVFLDDENKIMCIVEVWYTHKKSQEDIVKMNEYKILTFELKYESNYQKCKSIECISRVRPSRISEYIKRISEIKRSIEILTN